MNWLKIALAIIKYLPSIIKLVSEIIKYFKSKDDLVKKQLDKKKLRLKLKIKEESEKPLFDRWFKIP